MREKSAKIAKMFMSFMPWFKQVACFEYYFMLNLFHYVYDAATNHKLDGNWKIKVLMLFTF